jgi:hypothetical protein
VGIKFDWKGVDAGSERVEERREVYGATKVT